MEVGGNPPAHEQKSLFTYLVPGRQCGECVACCRILKIDTPELHKPAGVLCPHSTGTGCGIYETRPNQCRTWFCLWRRIGALPDEVRPDRCGVVFSLSQRLPPRDPFERLFIAARAINSEKDFEHPMAQAAFEMFVREGSLPVYRSSGGVKHIVFPRAEIVRCIITGAQPPEHLASEVASWSARYPPLTDAEKNAAVP
jgi:hypothetical protein